MKYLSSRIFYAIFLYVLIMTLIFLKKPSMLFEKNGEIKNFGLKKNETMYSVGVLTIVLAIVCFYLFCVIDMVFK
jgi:hypothetical protein